MNQAVDYENQFLQQVVRFTGQGLTALGLEVLQVNLGLQCNQQCGHCHLQAGPGRKEVMDPYVMEGVIALADKLEVAEVDITGGAPELHPNLKDLILKLKPRHRVKLRTNLTALLLPSSQGLSEFLADHRVELVASLPCYSAANVDQQRGEGVFSQSIAALQELNRVGYGSRLPLTLVYNPGGPSLPPDQAQLEQDYKQRLFTDFGIRFTRLVALANMPLGGFYAQLRAKGRLAEYQEKLAQAFNPATLDALMCRHQLHVNWQGVLSDCDFNCSLGINSLVEKPDLYHFNPEELAHRQIATANHCFTCAAGAGSSCGGSLA